AASPRGDRCMLLLEAPASPCAVPDHASAVSMEILMRVSSHTSLSMSPDERHFRCPGCSDISGHHCLTLLLRRVSWTVGFLSQSLPFWAARLERPPPGF